MRRAGRIHLRSWLIVVIALVAAALPGGLLAPSGAAADDVDRARVTIQSLAPTTLTAKSTLVVGGRVANIGTEELTAVSVRLTVSPAPLPDRAAIDEVAAGSPDYDGYALLATTEPVTEALGPGASAGYRISATTASLPLAQPGVYVLAVEAVGISPSLGYVVLGTSRVLLPWIPEPPAVPTRLVLLWPLSSWPGRTPDGTLLGTTLPREISPRGRLTTLLEGGAAAPTAVSWIVDPALLQSVSAMTDGYLVEVDGQVLPGDGEQDARRWLQTLTQVASDSRGPSLWALPYADVDADALQRAGLDRDVVRAVTTAPTISRPILGAPVEGTVYWAPGGRIDAPTVNLLASAGIEAIVVRDTTVAPTVPIDFTPNGVVDLDTQFGPVRAIVTDSGLSSALAMPQQSRGDILAARQRFLAETAFISLEIPDTPGTVVAAPAGARWSPDPEFVSGLLVALRTTPWVRLAPMGDLLTLPPSAVPRTRDSYGARAQARELPPGYLERVIRAQASLAALRSVVVNPFGLTEPIAEAILRSESSAWRTRLGAGEELLGSIQGTLDADTAQVYVVSKGTVTFSGDTGSVPVTVANDLDQPVVVGIQLTGSPSARLVAEPLPAIEIGPGRRASLEVPVRIIGGAPVPVSVGLIDGRGSAFGTPGKLELRTTAYSRAALWVALGAAVLLVILVVLDIVRRARQRARSQGSAA